MSQKASGYDRIAGDRYFTPAWPVEALIGVEHFNGPVVDPMAGGWDIVHTLSLAGIRSMGFDIEPPPPDISYQPMFHTQDMLEWHGSTVHGEPEWRDIISNPAYGFHGHLALKAIKHALALTEPRRGKVAMLLRVDFDSGRSRRPIFKDHPAFIAKYTLTDRVRWANLPEKRDAKGRLIDPTENHAWFVWDWSKRPGAQLYYGYLP